MKKVIVVTGGSSGIGKATADMLRNYGHTVVVLSRSVQTNADAHCWRCDVSKEEDVKRVFDDIGFRYGKIDVLINNAGYGVSGATELLPRAQVQNLFEVNVLGVVMCSKYALPYMHRGAQIINVSSMMAFFPLPFRTVYAASKSAVITISQGMRLELGRAGISVCAVCPGDVKTNFTQNRVKHYESNERYGDKVERVTQNLDAKENNRMDVSVVARVLFSAANKTKNPPTIIIGGKYKLLYAAQKFLPRKLILWATQKFFSGNK